MLAHEYIITNCSLLTFSIHLRRQRSKQPEKNAARSKPELYKLSKLCRALSAAQSPASCSSRRFKQTKRLGVTNGFKLISGKAFAALYRRHHVVVRVAHLKLDFVQTRGWPATKDTPQLSVCFFKSIKIKLCCKTLQIYKIFLFIYKNKLCCKTLQIYKIFLFILQPPQ